MAARGAASRAVLPGTAQRGATGWSAARCLAAAALAAMCMSMPHAGYGDVPVQNPTDVKSAAGVETPAGVENPQRAWQHWALNCQGCHRPDGTGSAGTTPSLAGTVARFLSVPGGREYLGRVPGVAASPLSSADLSEVMNWILWRFDKEHLPANFQPYTADEIGRLRAAPLRLEASRMRSELLDKAERGQP
jgi:mono/diheme cytochrome c family protein